MKKQVNNLKNRILRPAVSAVVFLSLVIIGGVAIIARNSNPSSLSSLKSGANDQKLTAQNWDALVDYVAGMDDNIQNSLTEINQKIIQISGSTNNTTNTTNTGSSIWNTNGTNIFYNSGNVGIGINNPTAKLQVNGNIIASNPTANNHVATKEYVDNHKPVQIQTFTVVQQNAGTSDYTVPSNYDICFVSWILHWGGYGDGGVTYGWNNGTENGVIKPSNKNAIILQYYSGVMRHRIAATDTDDAADDPWSCRAWPLYTTTANYLGSYWLRAIVSRGNDSVACQFVCIEF